MISPKPGVFATGITAKFRVASLQLARGICDMLRYFAITSHIPLKVHSWSPRLELHVQLSTGLSTRTVRLRTGENFCAALATLSFFYQDGYLI